jgi:ATP-dependent DNA helicase RecG
MFDTREFIVRKDIEEIASVSQATAVILLREMVHKGLVEKMGNGKLVKYRLCE